MKLKLKLIYAILTSKVDGFAFLKISKQNQINILNKEDADINIYYFGMDKRIIKNLVNNIENLNKTKE